MKADILEASKLKYIDKIFVNEKVEDFLKFASVYLVFNLYKLKSSATG